MWRPTPPQPTSQRTLLARLGLWWCRGQVWVLICPILHLEQSPPSLVLILSLLLSPLKLELSRKQVCSVRSVRTRSSWVGLFSLCMVVFGCYLLLLGQCHLFLLLLAKLVCIFFAWQLVTLSGVGWSGVRLLLMVVAGLGQSLTALPLTTTSFGSSSPLASPRMRFVACHVNHRE